MIETRAHQDGPHPRLRLGQGPRAGGSEMMLMKKKWEIPGENAGQMETVAKRGSTRLREQDVQRPGGGKQHRVYGGPEQFWNPGADSVRTGSRTGWWGPGLSDVQAKL